uniref:protein-serine/threonine phosphatase n=1 Tax=Glycine max TaxID=3847 RepID=A0A0R0K895_SOYBN
MYDLGATMPVGMDFPPPFTMLEAKDSAFVVDDQKSGDLNDIKPMTKGKPPRHASTLRHSISNTRLLAISDLSLDVGVTGSKSSSEENTEFLPILRSGSCAERGPKQYMEDEHICIDNLIQHIGPASTIPLPGAFYGVFDGHGGTDAALFIRNNILRFIVEDSHFPTCVGEAITSAFVKADYAFADSSSLDISSGTTALTALVFGRTMIVANAGDCRAVLGRQRLRIEKLGGVVYDGYLNGQLSVSRALGDWHMKGHKGSAYPLSAEPELQEINLTEDDEFLIMGCDGLWDVMSNQCAVTMARKELMIHNDPQKGFKESWFREGFLKRNFV